MVLTNLQGLCHKTRRNQTVRLLSVGIRDLFKIYSHSMRNCANKQTNKQVISQSIKQTMNDTNIKK